MRPDPVALLRRHFGHSAFRSGQEELVRAVLAGRDALGVLPTGGGKSVCYQVPALALGGLTLVVSPLVSLMEDQVARARRAGLRADHLSANQPVRERRAVWARARGARLDLLFVAPERLDSAAFRDLLRAVDLRLLAVDEAHCISEWGDDFRPAYRRIGAVRRRRGCPTLALTATATPAVRRDILATLGLHDPVVVVRSFDRPNLTWAVHGVAGLDRRARSIRALLGRHRGCAIAYGPTRRAVEALRDRLAGWGVRAEAYHAGLSGPERSRVQEAFMTDACRVVVATNAFGMGIDKPDVRLVVHVQLPSSLEGYYQEAGRAGRDGRPAHCVAFFAPADLRLWRDFHDRTHPPRRALRRLHRALLRLSGPDGVVEARDDALRGLVGPDLCAWREGDPVGPLAALERAGAVRRLVGKGRCRGTEARRGGSETYRIGIRGHLDVTTAVRLRRRAQAKLEAVQRFARTRSCRRRALLRYFGEERRDDCGGCDRCGADSWNRRAPLSCIDT